MHKYNDITIVIVSYKSKKQIIKLLKKIKINFKVIIIENSSDFSIKDYFKNHTQILIYFFQEILVMDVQQIMQEQKYLQNIFFT